MVSVCSEWSLRSILTRRSRVRFLLCEHELCAWVQYRFDISTSYFLYLTSYKLCVKYCLNHESCATWDIEISHIILNLMLAAVWCKVVYSLYPNWYVPAICIRVKGLQWHVKSIYEQFILESLRILQVTTKLKNYLWYQRYSTLV